MFLRQSRTLYSRTRRIFAGHAVSAGLLLVVAAFGVLVPGCISPYTHLRSTRVPYAVTRLAHRQPEFFDSPLTLVVMLDTTPCVKAFTETIWWKDWQEAAHKAGTGFVFATSRADSTDVAVAVKLEGIEAPILLLPSCPDSVLGLGLPAGSLPMKLLIDRDGHIQYAWCPLIKPEESESLIHVVDSISALDTHWNRGPQVTMGP